MVHVKDIAVIPGHDPKKHFGGTKQVVNVLGNKVKGANVKKLEMCPKVCILQRFHICCRAKW